MNPDEVLPALAPNQRARNFDARNQYQSFKKFIIIAIAAALIVTAIVVFQLMVKRSGKKSLSSLPVQLSDFPVFPDASLTGASINDSGSEEAEWTIESTDMDEVAAWYAGTLSEDDDDKEYEIIKIPDNYDSGEFTIVVKEKDQMININFKKQNGKISVIVNYM